MHIRVQKWGNNLAVRIPKASASQSHLVQSSMVENRRIIFLPVPQPEATLAQLLEGVTPSNLHDEILTGAPDGRETW
jgi:antitoxin MazE